MQMSPRIVFDEIRLRIPVQVANGIKFALTDVLLVPLITIATASVVSLLIDHDLKRGKALVLFKPFEDFLGRSLVVWEETSGEADASDRKERPKSYFRVLLIFGIVAFFKAMQALVDTSIFSYTGEVIQKRIELHSTLTGSATFLLKPENQFSHLSDRFGCSVSTSSRSENDSILTIASGCLQKKKSERISHNVTSVLLSDIFEKTEYELDPTTIVATEVIAKDSSKIWFQTLLRVNQSQVQGNCAYTNASVLFRSNPNSSVRTTVWCARCVSDKKSEFAVMEQIGGYFSNHDDVTTTEGSFKANGRYSGNLTSFEGSRSVRAHISGKCDQAYVRALLAKACMYTDLLEPPQDISLDAVATERIVTYMRGSWAASRHMRNSQFEYVTGSRSYAGIKIYGVLVYCALAFACILALILSFSLRKFNKVRQLIPMD